MYFEETEEVVPYKFRYAGYNFIIADTPGFDDDRFDDDVVVTRILTWLKHSFNEGIRLNGLIYMHRITDPRMRGTAVSNMSMFRKLCGPSCFKNVILATTFWGEINRVEGRRREQELCRDERFWGKLVERESKVVRIGDDVESDRRLLLSIATNSKCTLAAQQEMQDGNSMLETGAAKESNQNLTLLQQEYEEQLQNERERLYEELHQRKRLAKAELNAQRLASEKEREDMARQARQEIAARRLAGEDGRQIELQKHTQERARRDARLQRLRAGCDREKGLLNLDREKRTNQKRQYYKNYRCMRRTPIRRFRCNRCLNQFDARVVDCYRKSALSLSLCLRSHFSHHTCRRSC